MNLKLKEFNCEKAGFRAIHTENDADMFILNETAKTKSVGYLPVRVLCWNFFLPLQKLTNVVMLFGNFFSFGGSNSSK